MNMNWIDYIILGILFFSTIIGFSRGLIKELLSLVFLIAAFFIAVKYSEPLALYFGEAEPSSQSASYIILCLSFLGLFIGTIIVGAVINYFINSFFQAGLIGFGNRLLGILFGFSRGILVVLVVIFALQFTSIANEMAWQQSRLLPIFTPWVQKLNIIVSPKLDELKVKLKEQMDFIKQ